MMDFSLMQKPNMGQQFAEGYNIGAPIAQVMQQKQMMQQQELALQAEAERKATYQQAFNTAMGDPSRENWSKVYGLTDPKELENMQKIRQNVSAEVQQELVLGHSQALSAFRNGSDEVGQEILKNMAERFIATGDKSQAMLYADIGKKLGSEDEALRNQGLAQLDNILFVLDEDGSSYDNAAKAQKLRNDQVTSDLDVAEFAQTVDWANMGEDAIIKKMTDAGFDKDAASILAAFSGDLSTYGKLDRNGQIAIEDKYRSELLNLNKTGREALIKREKVREAAKAANALAKDNKKGQGPHDLVMVNIFQRFMDDGMVRSEDVKLQRASGGKLDEMITAVSGWTTGAVLSPKVRAQMVAATDYLMDAEIKMMDKNNALYEKPILANGLDRDLIFDDEYLKRQALQDKEIEEELGELIKPTNYKEFVAMPGYSDNSFREALIAQYGEEFTEDFNNASIQVLYKTYPIDVDEYINNISGGN